MQAKPASVGEGLETGCLRHDPSQVPTSSTSAGLKPAAPARGLKPAAPAGKDGP